MYILSKIIPNASIEVPLLAQYLDLLNIYQKENGRYYLKSLCSDGREKLVYNEETGKKAPEEIVRQLFLIELTQKYSYPKERIKIEQTVNFGRDDKKRADIIVYQQDNITPWILVEVKAPNQDLNPQQLKGYLNAEGSPIGVGVNGKNISRYFRPYPKEFEILTDLPREDEYQLAKKAANVSQKIKELIANRSWTLPELIKLNKEKHYDLRAIIEELQELVLANSGADSFNEIFKLIYTKLFDEFEAENRPNQTLFFRDYTNAELTFQKISQLFEEAKKEWGTVFEPTEKIKLTPHHLEIVIGKLTEVRLFGSNLRIIDEAFEYLIPEVAKGKRGQYFTPRVVIDACVRMLNPSRRDYVLDPACGSAGFLVHTMEYVWDKYNLTDYRAQSGYAERYLWGIDFDEKAAKISRAIMLIAGDGKTHIYQQNTLDYGGWSPNLKGDLWEHRLLYNADDLRHLSFDVVMSNPPFAGDIKEKSLINNYNDLLGLHYSVNLDSSNIKTILNTLSEDFKLVFADDTVQALKDKFKEINSNGEVDLENDEDLQAAIQSLAELLMEQIEEGRIADKMLFAFRFREFVKLKKSQRKWEKVDRHILFIQRILDALKPGGRAVIVLPQGIFNNSSEQFVRRYITERARILAVIGLHPNSFKPHTNTKTSLIFIRKRGDYARPANETIDRQEGTDAAREPFSPTQVDYPIFFATSKVSFKDNSGNYVFATDPEGNRLLDDKGNPIYQTDLFDIAQAFINWGKEQLENGDNDFSFLEDAKKKSNEVRFSISTLLKLQYGGRIDAEFLSIEHYEIISKIKERQHSCLKELCRFISRGRQPKYVDAGLKAVKSTHVTNSFIKEAIQEFVDKDFAYKNSAFILKYGDVVINGTGRGTLGRCSVFLDNKLEHFIDGHVTVFRILSEINPECLTSFINSKFGQIQIEARQRGASGQLEIYPKDFGELVLPKFSNEFQRAIKKVVQKAYSNLQDSIRLNRVATDILLEKLNLKNYEYPKMQYEIKGLVFETERTIDYVSFISLNESNRIDSEHYQPAFAEIESKIMAVGAARLGDWCAAPMQRGVQPAFEEGGEVFVVASKAVKPTGIEFDPNECTTTTFWEKMRNAKARIYPGDVLLNGTGRGTLGRAGVYTDERPALADNHVTILRMKEGINPFFVSLFLNSLAGQAQSEKWQTGSSGQLELYPFQMAKFLVPDFPPSVQNELGEMVRESIEARKESQQLIDKARRAVEVYIEEDEAAAFKFLESKE